MRKEKKTVLVVDDEPEILDNLKVGLADSYIVWTATNASEAVRIFDEQKPDAVAVDIALVGDSDKQGLDLIKVLRAKSASVLLIACSGKHDAVNSRVALTQYGATDYVNKNRNFIANLSDSLKHWFREQQRHSAVTPTVWHSGDYKMAGNSPALNKVRNQIKGILNLPTPPSIIYIHGERGTGKELVAQAIADGLAYSNKVTGQYIAIDTGTLAASDESIIRTTLFGAKKGAASNITQDRKGSFQETDNGVLFLDEIANLPIRMQQMLLRTLENGEIMPLGSAVPEKVKVVFISATNKNLQEEVCKGTFMEDLHNRITRGQVIEVPPLRERKEDIPSLLKHFIDKFNDSNASSISLDGDAEDCMCGYEWEGNIRELDGFIGKALSKVYTEGSPTVYMRDLPDFEEKGVASSIISTPVVLPPLVSSVPKTAEMILDEAGITIVVKTFGNADFDNYRKHSLEVRLALVEFLLEDKNQTEVSAIIARSPSYSTLKNRLAAREWLGKDWHLLPEYLDESKYQFPHLKKMFTKG